MKEKPILIAMKPEERTINIITNAFHHFHIFGTNTFDYLVGTLCSDSSMASCVLRSFNYTCDQLLLQTDLIKVERKHKWDISNVAPLSFFHGEGFNFSNGRRNSGRRILSFCYPLNCNKIQCLIDDETTPSENLPSHFPQKGHELLNGETKEESNLEFNDFFQSFVRPKFTKTSEATNPFSDVFSLLETFFQMNLIRHSLVQAAKSDHSKIMTGMTSFLMVLTLFFSFDFHGASAFVSAPPRKLQAEEIATVQIFQQSTPSVVYITNLAVRRDAFTLDVMSVPQGSGSGFIWDTEGHVVTNFHVIRGASDIRVTLGDQSVYEAKVVGSDEDKDVAVLSIDAPSEKLQPLSVGSSSDLLVGQKVYAIGNPFGLDHTLTTGVISGLRREISSVTGRPIQDVIQTDAAINPGNSGGPLLDSNGNLIGINTAIYSPSGASSGVGFSIPVDTVSGIVEQIVKYGKVTRPILGISFAPEQSVEQLGVSGVLVLDAPTTGPAGKAGLLPTTRDNYGRLVLGDIIISMDGQKVKNGSDLYKILDRCSVGQTVKVEVLRGDDPIVLDVVLEAKE